METIAAQLQALADRMDVISQQVQANTTGHAEMHPALVSQGQQIIALTQRVGLIESASSQRSSAGGTGEAARRRLDRMTEGRDVIQCYSGMSRGGDFRNWAFDVRDVLEQYEPRLAQAFDHVEGSSQPVGDPELHQMGVDVVEDRAIRRVLAKYTTGIAKTFVRSRAELGGLELWRQMAQYFDPMTDARAMADGGSLTQPPVAKDWEALGRQICAWEGQCSLYEGRTDKANHLPETFKVQAVWSMVPDKDKPLYHSLRRSCKTVVQMKAALLELVQERQQGAAPMMVGNVNQGGSAHPDGTDDSEEKEVLNTESGEIEVFKFEPTSGRWSKAGVRGRKPWGQKQGSESSPPAKRQNTNTGERDKGCFRCGKEGHQKRECRSKMHKDGYVLTSRAPGLSTSVHAVDTEAAAGEDVPTGMLQLCALEAPPIDPLSLPGGDCWQSYLDDQKDEEEDHSEYHGDDHEWKCPVCFDKGVYEQSPTMEPMSQVISRIRHAADCCHIEAKPPGHCAANAQKPRERLPPG